MIEVRNLTKRYSTFTAVDDISFTVEKGQILGFLGPNGAGKTTTMRVITGFMPPTKGTVVVAGFDVVEKPLEVKRRIGYLPESPPLYLEMTVNEYLAFAARLKQIPSAQVTEKIAGASQKAAISDVGDKVIKTLSKGYRQRVGLAQALIHDPEVLVLDEPTIGLDPIQIREVREMIKSLAHEHTIILSTHILPEVDMTCDSVVIIDRGKIIAQDTPDGLAKSLEGAEKLTIMAEGPAEEISAAVKDIRGVQKVVESTSENGVSTLTLECDFQFHVRKGLSEVMSEKGWGLLEMKVEETTLEDVFIHLMSDSSEEVVS
ncbi:MAG: ATP-binding cassette domain-containing protein [Candidatus Marinimicrobia bacterium]|nr:ATP-binding cassette domain-containing protein [Candidatus Neomarinimicrobiota bacterium]MDP6594112.1 ATP-binding cassette domain-containing protein [Candidatus Neomarinimicrobiota bacterium]MDP6835590.1 ATP-binding cassette domain-containing protein [Candidatus Neomarinimicrobiota bacterium]MDP6966130.1 ATP-binding cassette domain-containing protein [Candidatus Neomarinimicrobiota bacterium]|tara:strand:+ start:23209 stop:24159 length:951 start_codon:yes stop_codon:yes gene_type:complete